jgi:hypothetical protein
MQETLLVAAKDRQIACLAGWHPHIKCGDQAKGCRTHPACEALSLPSLAFGARVTSWPGSSTLPAEGMRSCQETASTTAFSAGHIPLIEAALTKASISQHERNDVALHLLKVQKTVTWTLQDRRHLFVELNISTIRYVFTAHHTVPTRLLISTAANSNH